MMALKKTDGKGRSSVPLPGRRVAVEATNHLHARTAAIFVGESTGAKPPFELRRSDFGLPYFRIDPGTENRGEASAVIT